MYLSFTWNSNFDHENQLKLQPTWPFQHTTRFVDCNVFYCNTGCIRKAPFLSITRSLAELSSALAFVIKQLDINLIKKPSFDNCNETNFLSHYLTMIISLCFFCCRIWFNLLIICKERNHSPNTFLRNPNDNEIMRSAALSRALKGFHFI